MNISKIIKTWSPQVGGTEKGLHQDALGQSGMGKRKHAISLENQRIFCGIEKM